MTRYCTRCGMPLPEDILDCPGCAAPRKKKAPKALLWVGSAVLLAGICLGVLFFTGVFSREEPVTLTPFEECMEEHLLLQLKDVGPCERLEDHVEIYFVFVGDAGSSWKASEQALAKNQLISRMADLEQEAKKYGTHLTLHGNFDEWVWESYALSGSAREWMEAYAADKGYRSLAEMQNTLDGGVQVAAAPIIFLVDREGRSFAYSNDSTSDDFEAAVLYDIDAFRHELFHLFGAMDYYIPDWVEKKAQTYIPWSIMNDGDVTDGLTAYAIGWTDTPSEDAVRFLASTIRLTKRQYAKARKEDLGY